MEDIAGLLEADVKTAGMNQQRQASYSSALKALKAKATTWSRPSGQLVI